MVRWNTLRVKMSACDISEHWSLLVEAEQMTMDRQGDQVLWLPDA